MKNRIFNITTVGGEDSLVPNRRNTATKVRFSWFVVSPVLPRLPDRIHGRLHLYDNAISYAARCVASGWSVHVHVEHKENPGYCTRSVKNVPLRRFRPGVALGRTTDINHDLHWRGWFADCRGQTYMTAPWIEPCQVFKLPMGSGPRNPTWYQGEKRDTEEEERRTYRAFQRWNCKVLEDIIRIMMLNW